MREIKEGRPEIKYTRRENGARAFAAMAAERSESTPFLRTTNPRSAKPKPKTKRVDGVGQSGSVIWNGKRMRVAGVVGPDGMIVWRSDAEAD